MIDRKAFVFFGVVMLCVLLLCSCGPGAPPETRAGTWMATSERGEFTFTVNSGGTGISEIAVKYEMTPECNSAMLSGSMTISNNFSFSQDLPIDGNKFSFEGPPKIEGKFSRDGASASGSWEIGDCASKWEATK